MSFGWIAVTATVTSAYNTYKTAKESKKAARRAEQQAAEEIAAIDRQTAQMKAEAEEAKKRAVAAPPPKPAAAPIQQAKPGTGSTVISPAMLAGVASRRKRKGSGVQKAGLGYGSGL